MRQGITIRRSDPVWVKGGMLRGCILAAEERCGLSLLSIALQKYVCGVQ
jgi:hypothetical protein